MALQDEGDLNGALSRRWGTRHGPVCGRGPAAKRILRMSVAPDAHGAELCRGGTDGLNRRRRFFGRLVDGVPVADEEHVRLDVADLRVAADDRRECGVADAAQLAR